MNLRLRHVDSTDTGGSSYLVHVAHAAEAIALGKCSVALITLAGRPRSEGMATGTAPRPGNPAQPDIQFEYPYGPTVVNMYAMCAMRHMYQYGTTSEAARLDQGRRLAPRAAQSERDAARCRHGEGSARTRRSSPIAAAPARLLRHQRRRRRARRRRARDREKPQAAAREDHRRRRSAERPARRRCRSHLSRARDGPARAPSPKPA